MKRNSLQWLAVAYGTVVLLAAAWFWSRQVESVIDLLRIAYG